MVTNEFRWGITPALPAHWPDTINVNQFEVVISAESIEAKAEADGKTDAMQASAEAIIEAIAREISLQERTSYKVRLGSFSQFNSATEQRSTTVFVPSPPALMLVSGRAEVLVTDANGTVIRDTRAERFMRLSQASCSFALDERRQRVIDYLLEYYEDSNRRLAPLYDIIEYVEECFSEDETKRKMQHRNRRKREWAARRLGIPYEMFEEVGNITNDRSIRISRHRGRCMEPQHDSTDSERAKCEALAQLIIDKFEHLLSTVEGDTSVLPVELG